MRKDRTTMLTDDLLVRIPALLLALTVHEAAHGLIAHRLGDPTAKEHGRLTLNPLAHLDPIGLLALWLVGFGWAKPVPVNPLYFKGDRRRGMFLVGLAGPGANFLLALLFSLFFAALPLLYQHQLVRELMTATFIYNVFLGVFNLLPFPPLDGSKVLAYFLPRNIAYSFSQLEQYGPLILILLIFSGILPRLLQPLAAGAIEVILAITAILTGRGL
jgi:Zn-dependent protease